MDAPSALSGNELEGGDVGWAHDVEMPAVQGGDLGGTESLGCGDDSGVDSPKQ